ncbi:MAG: hypothetical protein IKG67_13735 [Parasporobacterium sp.]|nr:hypothetical protein [Parasporobacterium sp.]
MAQRIIDKTFYDALCRFDESDEAKDYYYKIMDTKTGKTDPYGTEETVRDQILRVYARLFCEDIGADPDTKAGPDEVEATADRLYIGSFGFDPRHWYRMRYHFPVIDEDNYDRFAALVIADLNAGPLRDAIINGGEMLVVGEADPLHMTTEQRQNQKFKVIDF